MPLLKDGQFVDDRWTYLEENALVPEDGAVIIDLERWLVIRDQLAGRNAPLGLLLHPGQSPEDIQDDLDRFQMIALEFPAFKDGRAYSYARLLRGRFEFGGEVRAVGNVLRDQLLFMHRVGFDAFEVDERVSEADYAAELKKFETPYQSSSDDVETVLDRRATMSNSAVPK